MIDQGGRYSCAELRAIVGVDRDKCVNCHACISACPVTFLHINRLLRYNRRPQDPIDRLDPS
ncbi:MAG: hypothetical protein C0392_09065, partial [Syntrophus sp. (in: bacteria)]|nr:hypothetical protein [Syntrophus sp. (in: bacteria)]